MLKFVVPILFLAFFITCSEFGEITGDNEKKLEVDNNDKIETAAEYSVEELLPFKIEPEGDVDCFRFVIDRSGLYFLNTDSIPSSVSLWIYIYDKEQTQIAYRSPRTGDSKSISLGIQLPPDEYFVKLHAGMGEASSSEMFFKIERDLVDTFEVNGSFTNAYGIDIDEYYMPKIYPEQDLDFFSFSMDNNQICRIQIDSVSSRTTMKCALFDDENVEIATKTNITKENPLDWGLALEKGSYYIKLSAGYDQYAEMPYRFIIKPDSTDKTEWNNDTANAYAVELNNAVRAAIYPDGDEDYFKFSVDETDSLTFTIDSISSALSSLRLSLYDDEFKEISNYSTQVDGMIKHKEVLPVGSYYAKIASYSWSEQSSFKNYVFKISK